MRGERYLRIDASAVASCFEYSDFLATLVQQPLEVIGTIGVALSLMFTLQTSSSSQDLIIVRPLLHNLPQVTSFAEIRSNIVGNFVSLRGYVTRIALPTAHVVCASFLCNKCGATNKVYLSDGEYQLPTRCVQPQCNGRSFELVRSLAETTDAQSIRLQELDEDRQDRQGAPRTLETQLVGGLVDACAAGDVVTITGAQSPPT